MAFMVAGGETFSGVSMVGTDAHRLLAIVKFKGIHDMWWLENDTTAIDELKRYYRTYWSNQPITFRIFKEQR